MRREGCQRGAFYGFILISENSAALIPGSAVFAIRSQRPQHPRALRESAHTAERTDLPDARLQFSKAAPNSLASASEAGSAMRRMPTIFFSG